MRASPKYEQGDDERPDDIRSAMPMKPKILLVYAALTYPLRDNTKQLIECFREHGDAHWFYLNLAHKSAPSYLQRIDFDLIIFQTTFAQRLSRSENYYSLMMGRAEPIRKLPAPKVILVQDEFWNVAKVERFVKSFDVRTVFSVAPSSEWSKLYPNIDQSKVRFRQVLTGYIAESALDRMAAVAKRAPVERSEDIVYRAAGKPSPAWGSFGYLKQRLAEAVSAGARRHGLKTDISTDARDAIYGDDWYKFLASARYTIGAESGSSLLDREGDIAAKVNAFLAAHPEASFEEVERNCFAGQDGNLQLAVLGPRHLEACATRTCQILIRGDYNGLLKAGIHYIPVPPDLSGLDEILASLNNEERRLQIVQNAFEDIVRPRKITYEAFVRDVLETSLPGRAANWRSLNSLERRLFARMAWQERAEWAIARQASGAVRRFRTKILQWTGGGRELA